MSTNNIVNLANLQSAVSWTPVLSFGGGSTGITYSTQTGYYVQVGKFVMIFGLIILSNKGSSTGDALITGLDSPFPTLSGGLSVVADALTLTGVSTVTLGVATGQISLFSTSSGALSTLQDTNFNNNSSILFSGCALIG